MLFRSYKSTKKEYDSLINQLQLLLKGKNKKLISLLKQEMKIVVLSKMSDTREEIQQLSSVLRNSYHLERIADLATNIAEDVIYLVEGDIIRHNRLAEKKEN